METFCSTRANDLDNGRNPSINAVGNCCPHPKGQRAILWDRDVGTNLEGGGDSNGTDESN